MTSIKRKLAALCCYSLLINAQAHAAPLPGSLDASYGLAGVQLSAADAGDTGRFFTDSVLHNGDTVAVGFDFTVDFTLPLVARFKNDGTPDLNFGNAGVIALPLPLGTAKNASFSAAILQRANHYYIVVAEENKYHVYDVRANGSLNPAFGNAGIATIIVPGASPLHVDIADQRARLIIAANGTNALNNQNQAILIGIKFSNGALDTTFGPSGSGLSSTSIFSGAATSHSQSWTGIAVNPIGQIYAVGRFRAPSSTGSKIMAARFSVNGLLDPSFGTAGQVQFSLATTDFGRSVVLDSHALPVIVATSCDNSPCQVAAAKLNFNGSIAANWNAGQFAFFRFDANSFHTVTDVAIDANDRPIIAGRLDQTTKTFGLLLRLRANGSIDPSFGNAAGFQIDDFTGSRHSSTHDIHFDPLNNTLQCIGSAAQTLTGTSLGVLARYHN